MPLPSLSQLADRKKQAESKLKRLEESYQVFLAEWGKLSAEEDDLLKKVKKNMDLGKIHNVLKTINNLKD